MNDRTVTGIWFGVFGTIISCFLIVSSCTREQTTSVVKACMSVKGTNYVHDTSGTQDRCIQ
jgi:hypothetical protein